MSVLLGLWAVPIFVAVDVDAAVTAHLCLVFVSVCETVCNYTMICLCVCVSVSVFCSLSAKCLTVFLSQCP